MAPEFLPVVFGMLSAVMPDTIQNMASAGMNHRLGTEGLDFKTLAGYAADRGMSVADVWSMPEQDGWIYQGSGTGRNGFSYVCSAFTASVWKAAGLFDDLPINATEFTPRDMYLTDVFDLNFKKPKAC